MTYFLEVKCSEPTSKVVANVRRSALIAIGDCKDMEYLRAKRWDLGNIPNYRAFSNNSVVCNDIKDILDNDEFWAGYHGNGEPYGLINLELSKKCGRTGETQYPDPDVVCYNPSLRKGTKIITPHGITCIENLEGKEFQTKNISGEWVSAKCWLSGRNKQLYKITLESGLTYYSTPEHKWPVLINGKPTRTQTNNMKAGDTLPYFQTDTLCEDNRDEECGIYSSEEYRRELIRGTFNRATVTTESIILYKQQSILNTIQELLGFYGIQSKIGEHTLVISDQASLSHFKKVFWPKHPLLPDSDNKNTLLSVRVESVELTDIYEDVWDISVYDDSHCFQLSGCITGNCGEQSLNNYETCCLSELFLPNITTKDELFRCARYLYRICKHSLSLPCTDSKETERIVHKNMRMGIGVTGYLQATDEQRGWLSDCYKMLREFDVEYSRTHGFPQSIKLATVKPAGTLSLLGGCTSGVHPGFAQYYIRRIRISSSSPLIDLAKRHGYPVEYVENFDGTKDHSTVIISFPYRLPEGTVLAGNCTAVEQLNWVKKLQAEWSDNSVSCTVYYRKHELPQIKEWLRDNYNNNIKTVSFLLHSDHGFKQAPLEEITKEQYEEMMRNCKPITDVEGVCYHAENYELLAQNECVGGSCPLR